MKNKELVQRIFNISSPQQFDGCVFDVFQYQYENNIIYKDFCNSIGKTPSVVTSVDTIPFLPISFFKSHTVVSTLARKYEVFESSGTGNTQRSKHFVSDIEIYQQSYMKAFFQEYGNPKDYMVLALLPSYLERETSSLVYMVKDLINSSQYKESGFFLDNFEDLFHKIVSNTDKKILVIGVSFALLDFAEKYSIEHPNIIVMETGGMKGRKKEMIRKDLHQQLQKAFSVSHIHSEYGMTELLSQAYSKKDGVFVAPKWMQVKIRDMYDPFSFVANSKIGGVNIIDLANINSCSFIETQDLGIAYSPHMFAIEGRFDSSEVRGCNLMASS